MIDYGFSPIVLDAIEETALPLLKDWRNCELVRRWCRQVGLLSMQNQYDWFEKIHDNPEIKMFTINQIEDIADNVKSINHNYKLVTCSPVGVCGLTSIDLINRRAEFSLYVAPEHQGEGLSKPSLLTLFSFGFFDLNLNRIWGETFENNPAARIFEDLGMDFEGTRKEFYYKDGRYLDAHLYSISATNFRDGYIGNSRDSRTAARSAEARNAQTKKNIPRKPQEVK